MPIPFIIVAAILAALGLGGVALLIRRVVKKLAGKRVAIVGRQQVGKTSLLWVLSEGRLPDRARVTVDPDQGGQFSLTVGQATVDFAVPKDLPGNDGLGFADWKDAFSHADYVWYLFRADLIALGDVGEVALVKSHLDMFKDWMGPTPASGPKIILIGTWADKHPGFSEDSAGFKRAVASSAPIKIASVKLNNAGLVIGSLLTDKDARALVKSLERRL